MSDNNHVTNYARNRLMALDRIDEGWLRDRGFMLVTCEEWYAVNDVGRDFVRETAEHNRKLDTELLRKNELIAILHRIIRERAEKDRRLYGPFPSAREQQERAVTELAKRDWYGDIVR